MSQIELRAPGLSDPWVSLHDRKITSILCEENSVTFDFAGGFTLIERGVASATKSGRVVIEAMDFFPRTYSWER